MKIVSDAGPILSFARAGRLEILRQVVGELIIPPAVVEELAVRALLVDEREARKEAMRLGMPHFGSLKILKEAKDRGIIPEAKSVLDELITSGTYISDALYQDFLREVGEGEFL